LVAVHHVVQTIGLDDLHRPTSCRDWDVEALREHLGLYSVDVVGDPTLTRVPTDAVETYRNVIASTKW
jgi:hypothetical protein